jgi:hypothetical protein
MVDFNKLRCRNCKHWHDAGEPKGTPCRYQTISMEEKCPCTNWESNDNLIYLESLLES